MEKANKLFTIYEKYSNTVVYEYRGKKYEVEYNNSWIYGNGNNPKQQHIDAQAKIDEEIAREEANKNKIHKYEDSADYGFEVFWEYVNQ
jgi:hypothetical protein